MPYLLLTESFVVIGGRICRSTIRMDHFWSGSTSLSGLVKDWQTEFPKVVKKLENSFDELMVIYQLPEELRKRLRTNNTIERVNQEIRRRDRVIRIFPNDLSVLRLMGALLIEQNEKWAAGPRYLNMTVYHGIEKDDNSEEAGMLKLVK